MRAIKALGLAAVAALSLAAAPAAEAAETGKSRIGELLNLYKTRKTEQVITRPAHTARLFYEKVHELYLKTKQDAPKQETPKQESKQVARKQARLNQVTKKQTQQSQYEASAPERALFQNISSAFPISQTNLEETTRKIQPHVYQQSAPARVPVVPDTPLTVPNSAPTLTPTTTPTPPPIRAPARGESTNTDVSAKPSYKIMRGRSMQTYQKWRQQLKTPTAVRNFLWNHTTREQLNNNQAPTFTNYRGELRNGAEQFAKEPADVYLGGKGSELELVAFGADCLDQSYKPSILLVTGKDTAATALVYNQNGKWGYIALQTLWGENGPDQWYEPARFSTLAKAARHVVFFDKFILATVIKPNAKSIIIPDTPEIMRRGSQEFTQQLTQQLLRARDQNHARAVAEWLRNHAFLLQNRKA